MFNFPFLFYGVILFADRYLADEQAVAWDMFQSVLQLKEVCASSQRHKGRAAECWLLVPAAEAMPAERFMPQYQGDISYPPVRQACCLPYFLPFLASPSCAGGCYCCWCLCSCHCFCLAWLLANGNKQEKTSLYGLYVCWHAESCFF